MKYSKDMLLLDIIKSDSRVLEVFEKYEMNCGACNAIYNEKLEIACRANGIDTEKLLEELNSLNDR